MRGISWLAEKLLASHEGLCSMESVRSSTFTALSEFFLALAPLAESSVGQPLPLVATASPNQYFGLVGAGCRLASDSATVPHVGIKPHPKLSSWRHSYSSCFQSVLLMCLYWSLPTATTACNWVLGRLLVVHLVAFYGTRRVMTLLPAAPSERWTRPTTPQPLRPTVSSHLRCGFTSTFPTAGSLAVLRCALHVLHISYYLISSPN
jgi:hypothetical protein